MAVYLKLVATARIKIQDPCTEEDIERVKEGTFLQCLEELCDEDYQYEIEDAD